MNFSFLFCRETLARLDDYLDRRLSPEDQWQVKAHLKICHECARKFAFEESFNRELREKIAHIEAPPELLTKILARLPEEK